MDDKQRKEALRILAELSPRERRVLEYQITVVHRCEDSAMLPCCGEYRCSACHVTHIKERHGQHALDFYNKLSLTGSLTWKEVRYKQKQENKNRRKRAVVRTEAVIYLPEALSDEELEEALEALRLAISRRKQR